MTAPTGIGGWAGGGSRLQLTDQRIDRFDTILNVIALDLRPHTRAIHAAMPLQAEGTAVCMCGNSGGLEISCQQEAMTATPEAATTTGADAAVFTAGDSAASPPPGPTLTARHAGKAFAISAALVVAGVMLVIILAVITLANDGLHANWR